MHGVKWGSTTTADELAGLRRLSDMGRAMLDRRREGDMSEETHKQVCELVATNPDDYTMWNFRKEYLERLADTASEDEPQKVVQAWQDELKLTERALYRHPKAYAGWQHRVWLLDEANRRAALEDRRSAWLAKELKFCEALLRVDARNFHAWAHRERVGRISGALKPEEVVSYTEAKINDDLSNYSAWHFRSANLADGHGKREDGVGAVLDDEIDRLRQAFYTDPDSQSAWFYYRWLLRGAPYYAEGETRELGAIDPEQLEAELVSCEELIELEPRSKWALLTKVYLLERLGRPQEALPTVAKLKEIDPLRAGFYEDLVAAYDVQPAAR